MRKEFRNIFQSINLPGFVVTEMYCHVYGPVYGCLEHRVPNVQLQITEGKSSHVNIPPVDLPFLSLLLAVRSAVCHWRPVAVRQCVRTAAAHHQLLS